MSNARILCLGDFCRTGSGGTPSRNEQARYYDGGTIPWVKSGELREGVIFGTEEHVTDIALKETSVKLVPKGAILLAMYGATVGRLAILGIEATTNQAVCHIVPDPTVADTGYLFHALASQVPSIIAMGVGGAQPNINQGLVKNLKIRLPPLPEQRRIAAILDKTDSILTKRREALGQLDSVARSIFMELFGDPVTNPKGWPTKPLSELVANGDTVNYGVIQPGDDVDDGIPLVRVGDLVDGRIQHMALKRIAPDIEGAYKRSRLQGDEILVSCVGSIGVVALASPSERGFNIARAVARIRLSDVADRAFIATQLRTPSVQAYFTQELRTVSQPTLNIKQIAATKIVCPPLELQRQFATVIAVVESLKAAHIRAIDKLEALFTSIQSRSFQGEL